VSTLYFTKVKPFLKTILIILRAINNKLSSFQPSKTISIHPYVPQIWNNIKEIQLNNYPYNVANLKNDSFFFIHLFTCACVGPFLPHAFHLLHFPHPAHFQAEPVLPFSPVLLKQRHKK
jgi:hypothetical protein